MEKSMNALFHYVPTAEAAFIAGLSDRHMNRVVDERILPDVLFRGDDGRSFARLGAAFASFYFATEDMFVAQFRRKVLRDLTTRLEARPDKDHFFSLTGLPRDADWHVDAPHVTRVDIVEFVQAALDRTQQIEQAHAVVTTDPEVMGGQAVFSGTRLPIDNILSSLDQGIEFPQIQGSYPFLTDMHIQSARVYSRIHPKKGRPVKLSEANLHWNVRSRSIVRPAVNA